MWWFPPISLSFFFFLWLPATTASLVLYPGAKCYWSPQFSALPRLFSSCAVPDNRWHWTKGENHLIPSHHVFSLTVRDKARFMLSFACLPAHCEALPCEGWPRPKLWKNRVGKERPCGRRTGVQVADVSLQALLCYLNLPLLHTFMMLWSCTNKTW